MDGINVISVNPSQTTRAALHPEFFERIARECKVNSKDARSRHAFRNFINFVTGINGKISSAVSMKLLTLRIITGAGVLAIGCFHSHFGINEVSGIMAIILGILSITGIFTRIASFASLCYFGYTIALTSISGNIPAMSLIPAFTALIYMVLGPGFYSCDQLLRRSSLKAIKKIAVNRKNRKAEDRMSYRALAAADFK